MSADSHCMMFAKAQPPFEHPGMMQASKRSSEKAVTYRNESTSKPSVRVRTHCRQQGCKVHVDQLEAMVSGVMHEAQSRLASLDLLRVMTGSRLSNGHVDKQSMSRRAAHDMFQIKACMHMRLCWWFGFINSALRRS